MNKENVPNHVAIVPDGNRRWARKRDKKPWEGHFEGADRMEEIVREALDLGVNNLTFWGSSVDNLTKRPLQEKKALLEIYEKYFKRLVESEDIYDNDVKIRIVGRWSEQFPKKLVKILQEGIEKTKNHSKNFLNFLLAYNGDDDMLHAVNEIAKRGMKKVSGEDLRKNLLTADLPDVDLVIRTGVEGDPHNSVGFLMWQTQNSQYHFSEKNFPSFTKEDFRLAIEDYARRARRRGK